MIGIWRRRTSWLITLFVLLALSWIALGHRGSVPDSQRFRAVPFEGMFLAISCVFTNCQSVRNAYWLLMINGIGNVVVFAPLGASLYTSLESPEFSQIGAVTSAAFMGMVVSVAFEVVQIWIPGRVVALDDIILNGAGTLAGAVIASLVYRYARSRTQETLVQS